jgi:hypothetical protein
MSTGGVDMQQGMRFGGVMRGRLLYGRQCEK